MSAMSENQSEPASPSTAGQPLPPKRTFAELFFNWTRNDLIQTLLFLGWICCVCYVMTSTEHLMASFTIGIVVGINYSFLAIYHVNSIGAKGGDRAKNIGLIYLAPSVFMAILALIALLRGGGGGPV
ncbi:MAG: hypothetical protein AMXMBFR7_35090 [Planctomycetota bacterium]